MICDAKDKECIKQENAAKRTRSVIIDNAGDVSAQFPFTFERRLTKGEVDLYD